MRKFECLFLSVLLMSLFFILTEKIFGGDNLLSNSSFEVGWRNFHMFDGFPSKNLNGKRETAFDVGAVHGNKSLKFSKYAWDLRYITFPAIRLEEGKKYTVSFYMKSDMENNISYWIRRMFWDDITTGHMKLNSKWNRYSCTFTVPKPTEVSENLYYLWIMPDIKAGEGNFWIDAIQIEEGDLTEYKPSKKIEIGIEPEDRMKHNLYNIGDNVNVKIMAFSNDNIKKIKCNYKILDYFNRTVKNKEFEIAESADGYYFEKTLGLWDCKERGHYRAIFEVVYDNNIIDKKEFIFGVIKDLSKEKYSQDSPYAICIDPTTRFDWARLQKEDYYWKNQDIELFASIASRIGVRTAKCFMPASYWDRTESEKGEFVWSDNSIDIMRKYGVDNMIIVGNANRTNWVPEWARLNPPKHDLSTYFKPYYPNFDLWGEYVYANISHYKNKVKYWEIINEPNTGYTPEGYLELLKIAYQQAKKADPDCKIIGICGTTDFASRSLWWLETCAKLGALQYLDIISVHSISNWPPEDYHIGGANKEASSDVLRQIREITKKYGQGRNIPVWDTELSSYCLPTEYSDLLHKEKAYNNRMPPSYFSQGGDYLIRSFIIEMAGGINKIFAFTLHGENMMTPTTSNTFSWNMLNYDLTPKTNLIVYNGLIDIIGEATFAEELDFGSSIRCYIFENNNQQIAVLWNCLEKEIPLKLKSNTRDILILDVLGNPKDIHVSEGFIEVPTTGSPLYVVNSKLNKKSFIETLKNAECEAIIPLKISKSRIKIRNGQPVVSIELENTGTRSCGGKVRVTKKPVFWSMEMVKIFDNLKPREKREIVFDITDGFGVGKDKELSVAVEIGNFQTECKIPVKIISVKQVRSTVNIDGNMDDMEWGYSEPAKIDTPEQVKIGDSSGWHEDNLSAQLFATWDDKALYLGIKVKDKYPEQRVKNVSKGFLEACVELMFDTELEMDIHNPSFSEDDHYFLLIPRVGVNKQESYWHRVGLGTTASLNIKEIEFASKQTDTGYTMEVKIPFQRIGVKPQNGLKMGFDMAIDGADITFKDDKGHRRMQLIWAGDNDAYSNTSKMGIMIFNQ